MLPQGFRSSAPRQPGVNSGPFLTWRENPVASSWLYSFGSTFKGREDGLGQPPPQEECQRICRHVSNLHGVPVDFCDVGIIVMACGSYVKTGPGSRLRASTASPPVDLIVFTPCGD